MIFHHFSNLNINFVKSHVSTQLCVSRRGMFTRKWLEKFVNSPSNTVGTKLISQPVRNYPGDFIPFKQLDGKTTQGEPLDLIHVHIMDAKTRVAFAYATSAKKGIDGKPTYRLGNDKLNGHITRLRDPKTNEYLKDEQGNYILDPASGGQRIGLYKYPRILNNSDKMVKIEESQHFFDRNEEKIEKIIQESNILNKRPEIK